jgi:hypothetical protein
MKKNIATFKSRLIDFERGLFGAGPEGSQHSSHQGHQYDDHTCVATLDEFHKNLKRIEARFVEKLEKADMIRDQMRCDFKRLQRQHFGVTKDFE